jgi:hypothetical protein
MNNQALKVMGCPGDLGNGFGEQRSAFLRII